MASFKKLLKQILTYQFLFYGGVILLVLAWPQPTLDWGTVEKMASEYMDLCTAQTIEVEDKPSRMGITEPTSLPLEGTVVVITGATSGIGQSLASAVHRLGSTVVVIGRSQSKLEMLEQILGKERIVTILGDNANLESMSNAAETIKSKFDRIDFLVNNAGMHYGGMNNPLFWKSTKEGYDWLFTVNYLSHFLLTEKLLPLLEKSYHKPRIIQVSSSYHWKVDGSELFSSTDSSSTLPYASRFDVRTQTQCARSYANSKFAQILHSRALSRRLATSTYSNKVRVLSICPSWVATHLSDGKGLFQDLIHRFALRSDGPGIRSTLNAMLLPQFDSEVGSDEEDKESEEQEDLQDFLTNTFDFYKWFLYKNLGLVKESAREFRIRDIFSDLFFPLQIPFQNIFHRDLMIERSAPETYNVTLQESLYEWSLDAVKGYL